MLPRAPHLALATLVALAAPAPRLAAQATLAVTSLTTVSLPTPGAADYDAFHSTVGSISYVVTDCPSGRTCYVSIYAASPTIDATATKSVSDVEWQLDGTAGWFPLSTLPGTAQTIVTASGSGKINFRVRLSWARDTEGRDYLADVRVALTQQ
jgi:hypothetical protein